MEPLSKGLVGKAFYDITVVAMFTTLVQVAMRWEHSHLLCPNWMYISKCVG